MQDSSVHAGKERLYHRLNGAPGEEDAGRQIGHPDAVVDNEIGADDRNQTRCDLTDNGRDRSCRGADTDQRLVRVRGAVLKHFIASQQDLLDLEQFDLAAQAQELEEKRHPTGVIDVTRARGRLE